jgi:hypothetical protein
VARVRRGPPSLLRGSVRVSRGSETSQRSSGQAPHGGGLGLAELGLDRTFAFILGVLLILCFVAYHRGGVELVGEGLSGGGRMLVRFALVMVVSFMVAGLAEKLIPNEWIKESLGESAGLRGLLLATATGAVTPSGPFLSMPIAATMLRAGAGTGAVAAFLTSWSVLSLHRLIAWEIPIIGWKFAVLRWIASLMLPIAAGMLMRIISRT